MSDMAALITNARQAGYSVSPWPVSRGGGVLVYDARAGYWLLVGCKSARWREAWGHCADVEEAWNVPAPL